MSRLIRTPLVAAFVAFSALGVTPTTASISFAQCPTPASYCSTSPNSVGPGALMSWTGTPSIEADDFHLVTTGLPPGQFLLFYYGAGQASVPFGNGVRCVGDGGVGYFRFLPPLQVDNLGLVDMKVGYTLPPAGGAAGTPGVWLPGSTWYCQAWYRDPAAGGAGFNFSDGLEVPVCVADPVVAFSEDFDGVTGPSLPAGWSSGANAPPDSGSTAWELGPPSSVGPAAAHSPDNCVGTNLAANYGPNTDVWLRTPSIDLGGNTEATLTFKEFKAIEDNGADLDFGTLRLLIASDLTELAVLEAEVEGTSADWEDYSVVLPPAAFAQPIVIEFGLQTDAADVLGLENGGFELPVLPDGVWNTVGGPGWSVLSGSGGIWNTDTTDGFPGEAFEGENVGWISSGGGDGALSQSLSATLTANTQYVLSAQVGNPLFNGSQNGGRYRLELLAGGVVLQSQAGNSPGSGQWQARSMSWSSGPSPAQLGGPLEVRLIAEASNGFEVDYDDVSLTATSNPPIGFAGWYVDDVEIRLEASDPEPTWQVLPNSPLAPYYHHDDIFFIDDDTGWVCNISGEIWKTTDGGDTWTRVANQPGTSFRTLTFVDEMNGWVGNLGPGSWVGSTTDLNALYATTDGGLSWNPVTNISPMPDGICGLYSVGTDTIHGAGRYAGDAYFISSTDGGATWVSQDLSASYNAFVDVLFRTPTEGYITGNGGPGLAVLLNTTDGGASWTTAMSNNSYHYWKMGFASSTFGYAVCWSGPDADTWIQTYDGGQTWTDRIFAGGYEANGIGFANEQTGWIGGDETFTYETVDGGNAWNAIQIDTVYGDYINKFLRVSEDVVYAVGSRIYKYSAEHSSGQSVAEEFDNSRCELAAVPSGGTTTLTYTVPEDGHVLITVYVRGGLIYDRIVDERQRAGTYSIEYRPHDDTPVLYASIVTGRYRQRIKFNN